jgi:hypothetical protein
MTLPEQRHTASVNKFLPVRQGQKGRCDSRLRIAESHESAHAVSVIGYSRERLSVSALEPHFSLERGRGPSRAQSQTRVKEVVPADDTCCLSRWCPLTKAWLSQTSSRHAQVLIAMRNGRQPQAQTVIENTHGYRDKLTPCTDAHDRTSDPTPRNLSQEQCTVAARSQAHRYITASPIILDDPDADDLPHRSLSWFFTETGYMCFEVKDKCRNLSDTSLRMTRIPCPTTQHSSM